MQIAQKSAITSIFPTKHWNKNMDQKFTAAVQTTPTSLKTTVKYEIKNYLKITFVNSLEISEPRKHVRKLSLR